MGPGVSQNQVKMVTPRYYMGTLSSRLTNLNGNFINLFFWSHDDHMEKSWMCTLSIRRIWPQENPRENSNPKTLYGIFSIRCICIQSHIINRGCSPKSRWCQVRVETCDMETLSIWSMWVQGKPHFKWWSKVKVVIQSSRWELYQSRVCSFLE